MTLLSLCNTVSTEIDGCSRESDPGVGNIKYLADSSDEKALVEMAGKNGDILLVI